MTVMLDRPAATVVVPTPRRPVDDADALIDRVSALPVDEIALALVMSDLPTADPAALAALDVIASELDPQRDVLATRGERPGNEDENLAVDLASWAVQGMDRLGGEIELWRQDYAVRRLEAQGLRSGDNPVWGSRARMKTCWNLACCFHTWAGQPSAEPEIVCLWHADAEFPQLVTACEKASLRDLRMIASMRPEWTLQRVSELDEDAGYRWVPSAVSAR